MHCVLQAKLAFTTCLGMCCLLLLCFRWGKTDTGSFLTCCCSDSMYKGHCAECNAHWHSKAFKSRPAGYELPVASERRLSFVFESATNNKICGSCNQKNIRLMKRDRDEKEDQKIEEAKMARLHERSENASIDCEEGQETVDMTEKEGTAISVLLYLSKL